MPKSAVGHDDQLPPGRPAADLFDQLTRPIGERLVLLAQAVVIALGRAQCGQKRQRPDPGRPGYRHQQHHAQPAQTAGFDEVALTGAHGIAVDAAGGNLRSPAAFDGVVQTKDQRPLEREGAHQERQQDPAGRQARPHGAIQDPMIGLKCVC